MATFEKLPDSWHRRDLPVLREAARIIEADDNFAGARFQAIAQATGFDVDEILRAARALEADAFVQLDLKMPKQASRISNISASARREVGLWPTEETALDRMIAALESIAENTDDEDTRTRARKILDGFAGATKTIGLSVAAAAITGQIPGAS